jgi:ABC-type nitrate/sulfonate/bicarbonate transport system permease component
MVAGLVAAAPAGRAAVAVRGARVSAASSVLGAFVAEWVASGSGLGYLILQSGVQFQVGTDV